MIRKLEVRAFEGQKQYIEAAGLSTDSKPTLNVVTGSLFLEVNTGDVYAFDEISAQWKKIAALGGAGS